MEGLAEAAAFEGDPLTGERVGSVLRVARSFGSGVSVAALSDLLPPESPRTETEVARWLARNPSIGRVIEGRAYAPEPPTLPGDLEERQKRAAAYESAARGLGDGPLAGTMALVRYLGITGSTAYGEPSRGDDLDFLVVTRTGSVWAFLAYTYLALRLRRAAPGDPPEACFNFVLDEAEARKEYAEPKGFLFAREALMTRPLRGAEYYRGLLGSSPWLRSEVPRLFARWEEGGLPAPEAPRPAPIAVRVLNAVLFPWVAAYLQVQGLRRNHALRLKGYDDRSFRTVTAFARLAFTTHRFDRLRDLYTPSSRPRAA
ncbi:MAG TPA: hypothetical protein VIZ68_01765 [Thermoplasmata archaeon]